jgi:hypothetical protein
MCCRASRMSNYNAAGDVLPCLLQRMLLGLLNLATHNNCSQMAHKGSGAATPSQGEWYLGRQLALSHDASTQDITVTIL